MRAQTLLQYSAAHKKFVLEHEAPHTVPRARRTGAEIGANAGYEGKVKIGMDVAASEFYTEDKMYDLDFKTADNDGSQKKTAAQMQDMYKSFVENYPVVSIEDPFDQVRRFRVSSPPAGVERLN